MAIGSFLMMAAFSVNLTVSNPTDMQRQELVAVDLNQIGVKAETPFVVVNGASRWIIRSATTENCLSTPA